MIITMSNINTDMHIYIHVALIFTDVIIQILLYSLELTFVTLYQNMTSIKSSGIYVHNIQCISQH